MVLTPSDHAADRLRAASPVVDALGDAWIVGGAVRDALLGRPAGKDLDVVDPVDGVARARSLQERLGGALTVHDRFGTATLEGDGWGVDVATSRAERYPAPGSLPEVTVPAPLPDDLRRRDFTVNAIALSPGGEMVAFPGALDDLADGHLRVLHEHSFEDDPTRLYRLARYAARLGFAIDAETERLAREAFAAGAPATAGPARVGNEYLLILGEEPHVAVTALERLRELGGLDPAFAVDADVVRRAVALLPRDHDPAPLLLAAVAGGVPEGWHVADPGVVADAARDPAGLAAEMGAASRPSQLHALLRKRTPEAIALAGAHGAEEAARRWRDELRDVRLEIGGDDLIAAGIPAGPEIGRRLDAALARKLDEGVSGREAELAAALDAERP
jgi:tRNA nucleotidyltransferase (CCA-adding enzyme)